MTSIPEITIRRAHRGEVVAIVEMLADDYLGCGRERLENPLGVRYSQAFERFDRDPNIALMVAEEAGVVVGSLQLCVLPGPSSQGASRGLIEDVRVASDPRSRGIGERPATGAVAKARADGCKLVELLIHQTRSDAQRVDERLGFSNSHLAMTIRL